MNFLGVKFNLLSPDHILICYLRIIVSDLNLMRACAIALTRLIMGSA